MLVDANVLLYARDERSPFHPAAIAWLTAQLEGDRQVGIAWSSILAFLRLSTNPRVWASPLTPTEAWDTVEAWFVSPVLWTPAPTDRHRAVLGSLVTSLGLSAKLIPDAHLAALALEHGLEVCSADSDFARFPGLRWRNPLVG